MAVKRWYGWVNPIARMAIGAVLLTAGLWWAVGAILLNSNINSLISASTTSVNNQQSNISGARHPDMAASMPVSSDEAAKMQESSIQTSPGDSKSVSVVALKANEKVENLFDGVEGTGAYRYVTAGELESSSPDESSVDAATRRLKQTLGIRESKPPTRALDVFMAPGPGCDGSAAAVAPVSVQFRYDSPTVKTISLQQLKILIAEYRECENAVFEISENPLGNVDANEQLTQRRLDELKYFFLQHSVPKSALRYPDSS